ncbi:M56 family metallopeptidase [Lacinutrix iliipiscaria]|uniref:M56 family metallopeptidase n=1 Tax=Lacinutrix iliipiscaria TaxID=1230532 RepID=A0ABW5WRU7_9FLAO
MEYLLKASAVTALFYLCYTLFLKRDTFFESNRWFLLIGLISTICLPFIVIPIYIENTGVSEFIISNNAVIEQPHLEDAFSFLTLIPYIYSIGFVFFLIKLSIEFISLFKLLNSHVTKTCGAIKYIETENAIPPFSFFNYIVYNPKHFNAIELEDILNHEKAHVKQWHSVDILLAQIATIIFWFNPFIWLYKKDIQQNLEFIADQNAQRISICEKSYQHLLLKATVKNQHLVLTNNFYNSLIKKRIVMLHKSKSNQLNVLKYALVIPLLALFLMSFNTKDVYVESENTIAIAPIGDIEIAIISKDFKDADLEKVKNEFKSKGVTLKFKGLKRNAAGEIIAIKIDAKSEKSSASFNTNSDEGIKPIKITYDSESNSISIGNGKVMHGKNYYFSTADGKTKIHETHAKEKGRKHVYVISDDGEDDDAHEVEIIIEDEHGNAKKKGKVFTKKKSKVIHIDSDDDSEENVYIIKKGKDGKDIKEEIILKGDGTHTWVEDEDEDGSTYKIRTIGNKDKNRMLFIANENGSSPLVLIDDKESTTEAMEKLNPDNIEKMEILKGDNATSIYGEKGKDGVIIVTTKKH